ncbi:hypothetical protein Ntsu_00910 [Nocardia sp. IFM 10818]
MTGEPLLVPLAELRRSFEVLLDHVEAVAGTGVVSLDKDYFWSVPAEQLYDINSEPSDLTIGQLSESWQHMRDLLTNQDRALSYHLVWLADVLRAIGQDIVR